MRGEEDVGLGGMVVMTGVVEITTEAGMGALSWSMLGLDGSSMKGMESSESSRLLEPDFCLESPSLLR